MTGWPSFADLQNREHPAVLKALDRVCGLCAAPKGQFCRGLSPGAVPVTVVHYGRAVNSTDEGTRKKEQRNDMLA